MPSLRTTCIAASVLPDAYIPMDPTIEMSFVEHITEGNVFFFNSSEPCTVVLDDD